jgi:preprotein translocase subunit YajC
MFISTAAAQTTGGGGLFGDGAFVQILPLILIFVVFYFLLIRPQQKKVKEHRDLIASIRRNDVVVTGGGIVGKVTKVIDDHTVQVEIADNVRVRVERATIAGIRSRGEAPEAPATSAAANSGEEKKGLLSFLTKK